MTAILNHLYTDEQGDQRIILKHFPRTPITHGVVGNQMVKARPWSFSGAYPTGLGDFRLGDYVAEPDVWANVFTCEGQ